MKAIQKKIRSSNNSLILFFLLLFLIAPFISILIQVGYLFTITERKNSIFYVLILTVSIYLGLINTTIIANSDLVTYLDMYDSSAYLSLNNFLLINTSTGLIFNVITYLIFYISNGSHFIYILAMTILIYLPLLISIFIFYTYYNSNNFIIALAIIFAAFSPQLFALSNNIIRQLIAASLFMYAFINNLYRGKKKILFIVAAIFIHSTIITFLPVYLWSIFYKRITLKRIVFFSSLIITLILFRLVFLNYLISSLHFIPLQAMVVKLMRNPNNTYAPPSLSINIIMIFILLITIFKYKYKKDQTVIKENKTYVVYFPYMYVVILYINFLLIYFLFYRFGQVSHRLVLYFYFLIPFFFPFLFIKNGKFVNKFITGLSLLLIFVFFIYRLNISQYIYAPPNKIYGDLIFYLLLYN